MPYRDRKLENTFWGVEGGRSVCGFGAGCSIAQKPHAGDDVLGEVGTDILALAEGVVYRSRNGGVSGYHQEITVRYDVRSVSKFVDYIWVLYGHCLKNSILPVGARVKRGQRIAKVGTRADAMGTIPHAHIQMWTREADAAWYSNPKATNPKYIREALEPAVIAKAATPPNDLEEETGRRGYKVVDWRGKLPGSPASNLGSQAKTPGRLVVHYSGPDGSMYQRFRAGQISLFDLIAWETRYQMTPNLYDWGFTANGMMYHEVVWEDTVYIVRNPDAKLYHCADGVSPNSWNFSARSIHLPIVEGQRASRRTLQTLTERCDDLIKASGYNSRNRTLGHKEISSTACPGTLMTDFVVQYRAGKLTTAVLPKPSMKAPLPSPAKPTPAKPVDVGPYAKDSIQRINRFFGTNYGQVIAEEADRASLDLAICCALVEQESGGRNIFGADYGTRGADRVPFAHLPVTRERVKALVAHVRAGGVSNGVGLSQITWRDFIYEAEALGGAHIPRNQLRVGFRLLRAYLGKYDYHGAIGAYNAGEGNRNSVRWTYSASVAAKHSAWKARLR